MVLNNYVRAIAGLRLRAPRDDGASTRAGRYCEAGAANYLLRRPIMATIDIRIEGIDQLFGPPEFASLHQKALGSGAENHIVDYAGEYDRREPLRLLVHAPVSIKPLAAEVTRAIHAHFELAHAQCRRRYKRRMRIGRSMLVAGSVVLGIALLLRALLGNPGDRAMIVAIGEGLLILGWVAMWRPVEILLFERLENHQNSALFLRLAQMPVDFEFDVAERGQSEHSAQTIARAV